MIYLTTKTGDQIAIPTFQIAEVRKLTEGVELVIINTTIRHEVINDFEDVCNAIAADLNK